VRESRKREYPPLLPEGVHPVDVDGLHALCVTPFRDSPIRAMLFNQFRGLIERLSELNVSAEVWVNGSFLTRKPNPRDVDVVIWQLDESVLQGELIELVNRGGAGACDVFAFVRYPPDHPLAWQTTAIERELRSEFGFDRSGRPKGIASVRWGPRA
jgi:hypothetical protein